MHNEEEAGRDIKPPRIISIPGSQLDVETKLLRRAILAQLRSRQMGFGSSDALVQTIERLAKIENWENA